MRDYDHARITTIELTLWFFDRANEFTSADLSPGGGAFPKHPYAITTFHWAVKAGIIGLAYGGNGDPIRRGAAEAAVATLAAEAPEATFPPVSAALPAVAATAAPARAWPEVISVFADLNSGCPVRACTGDLGSGSAGCRMHLHFGVSARASCKPENG